MLSRCTDVAAKALCYLKLQYGGMVGDMEHTVFKQISVLAMGSDESIYGYGWTLEAGTSVQPQDTAQEQIIALWPSCTSTTTIQVPQSPVYFMMVTHPSTPNPQAEEPILLSEPHSSIANQSDSPRAALAYLRAQLRTVNDGYDGPPDGKCWPEGLLNPADYVDLNEWVSTAIVSSSETENLHMTVMDPNVPSISFTNSSSVD
eukprot:gene12543-15761_t